MVCIQQTRCTCHPRGTRALRQVFNSSSGVSGTRIPSITGTKEPSATFDWLGDVLSIKFGVFADVVIGVKEFKFEYLLGEFIAFPMLSIASLFTTVDDEITIGSGRRSDLYCVGCRRSTRRVSIGDVKYISSEKRCGEN
uniref:Uncharacterized protein n=1 Tax=Glossina austeni TaxID=7395 RepID=A0A1A9UFS1_GLOAU